MNMLNEDTVKKLWKGLFADWAEVRDVDDDISWRKTCSLFTVYLFESKDEDKKWLVEILDAGSQLIYEHILTSAERGPAMMEANELISEFVGSAFHMMMGFASKTTQPYTEVRFKQIVADGHTIYGLDSQGAVFQKFHTLALPEKHIEAKNGWKPISMVRYDTD